MLAEIPKGSGLQLAERDLVGLRARRGDLGERERALIAAVTEGSYNRAQTSEAAKLEAEKAALDRQIVAARIALREARAAWLPKLTAEVVPHRAAAAKRIIATIETLKA